jgi:hypothetical protein
MKRLIATAVLVLMMASGAALAQTDPAAKTGDPNAADKQKSITEDPETMRPFYSDNDMTTLLPVDEFKSAWAKMAPENQAAAKEQCKNPESEKLKDFCGLAGKM